MITPKRYEIGCQLLLITNSKSHTGIDWFRVYPRWPWMTLNGVIAFILRFFSPNSIRLLTNYVTVVEYRPIMSAKYCPPPVPVFHFWPKLTHRAVRCLCGSLAFLVEFYHLFHISGTVRVRNFKFGTHMPQGSLITKKNAKLGQRGREGITLPAFGIMGPPTYLGNEWR